jgi:transposase
LRRLEVAEPHNGRRFKCLYVILDNYGIPSSRVARAWLTPHPHIRLLFQPAYYPWVNAIERPWKVMHDTVKRYHRYTTIDHPCAQCDDSFMSHNRSREGSVH